MECLNTLDVFLEHVAEIKIPIINFHGSGDAICELKGSQILQEKAQSTDKMLHVSKTH